MRQHRLARRRGLDNPPPPRAAQSGSRLRPDAEGPTVSLPVSLPYDVSFTIAVCLSILISSFLSLPVSLLVSHPLLSLPIPIFLSLSEKSADSAAFGCSISSKEAESAKKVADSAAFGC